MTTAEPALNVSVLNFSQNWFLVSKTHSNLLFILEINLAIQPPVKKQNKKETALIKLETEKTKTVLSAYLVAVHATQVVKL